METNPLNYWFGTLASVSALVESLLLDFPTFFQIGFALLSIIYFGVASYLTWGFAEDG